MSPQTFAMSSVTHNSTQTFSYFIPPQWEIIILLSPTNIGLCLWLTSFLSLFSNKTFAMTVAMQIPHRHLAALFHLYSAYIF